VLPSWFRAVIRPTPISACSLRLSRRAALDIGLSTASTSGAHIGEGGLDTWPSLLRAECAVPCAWLSLPPPLVAHPPHPHRPSLPARWHGRHGWAEEGGRTACHATSRLHEHLSSASRRGQAHDDTGVRWRRRVVAVAAVVGWQDQLHGGRGGGLVGCSRWKAGEEKRWCLLAMALDATLDAVLVLAGLGNVTDPLDRLIVGLFEDLQESDVQT